jgi:regulator of RNase E activity RraA
MLRPRHNPPAAQPRPELIEAFRGAATAVISDNLSRLSGAIDLRPFHRTGKLVGTALTVRTRSGDNLAIHQTLNMVRPGDVVRAREAREAEIIQTIRDGKYEGVYGRPA